MKITKLIALLILVLTSCSQAAMPTSTPTQSPSSTSTLTTDATATITPPPVVYPTQVYGLLVSPDGTKKIQSLDWNNYEILDADGTVLWSLSYDNKFEVPEPGMHPFHWSMNGKYIYLTCYHGPDDSSNKFWGRVFGDGDCVFRFDVDTGEMTEIIPDLHPGYYAFSISPDDTLLVYANQTETPVKIKLLDLNTNEESVLVTADEKVTEMGSFGWSPNMDQLIFTTLEQRDNDEDIYSIFMLDLKSLEKETIVDGFRQYLGFDRWDASGVIYYHDTYRAVWQLNLENKMLMPSAMPTLTLSP